jgi:hypothetical protein
MSTCRCVLRKILSLVVFSFCLRGTGQSAFAQDFNADVRRFAPLTDPDASLALQPTGTPGPGAWSTGFVSSYARRLLVLRDASGRESVPIADQLSADFLFNVGLGERLALGLRVPTILQQKGDANAPLGWQVPRTALGDAAFDAKAVLIPRGALGGYGLSSFARMTAPTGAPQSTISNAGVTGELGLLGELDWIIAALRVSAGVLVRSDKQVLLGDTYGHELPWAVGLLIRPRALGIDNQGKWQWFVESSGALALSDKFAKARTSPASFGLGARYALAKDFSALLGVQLPLDSAVGVPSVRAVFGISWAPRFADADKDGIADDADDCPELAEDRNGVEDDDGCPESDFGGDETAE